MKKLQSGANRHTATLSRLTGVERNPCHNWFNGRWEKGIRIPETEIGETTGAFAVRCHNRFR